MRARIKFAVTAVAVIALIGGYHLQHGGWMMLNSKYDQVNLIGLTSAQVVHRLGTPSYDPRIPSRGSTQPSWTSEVADGPLVLGYYQGGATCRIEFMDDRVVSVSRYWK